MLYLLLNGFFLLPDSIPGWWIWVYWSSPLTYIFYAAINNEFAGVVFDCHNSTTTKNVTSVSMGMNITTQVNSTKSDCAFKNGDELLSFYGADNHTLLVCVSVMHGLVGVGGASGD
jgi:ABC-type multidrug transport system permease subunit